MSKVKKQEMWRSVLNDAVAPHLPDLSIQQINEAPTPITASLPSWQRQAAIAFANGISPLLGAKLSGSASPTEIVYKALDVFFSGTEPSDDELAKLGRMLYMVKKLGVNWNPADVPVVYQSKVFQGNR